MESIPPTSVPARQAALSGLAVVGFMALIVAGLYLGIYAGQFVPSLVNGVGSAAVYLGSVFAPGPDTASTTPLVTTGTTTPDTITFGTSTPVSTPTRPTGTTTKPPVNRTPGGETSGTYPIGGAAVTSTTVLSGLPDLMVKIDATGYLATTSADSFVATSTVPSGSRPAVRFTIKNIGTNATGLWKFSATIPTQTSYLFQSQPQQSLMPGDSIQYTLGFDQANTGANQTVSVSANYDKGVTESNYDNDSASAQLTILGS